MKKLLYLLIFVSSIFFMSITDVSAFSSADYKNRSLCGNYELAGFHSDGVIDTVNCYSTYEEARRDMNSNGAIDLAIMTKLNGETRILDANMALVDLSVHGNTTVSFYDTINLKYDYTYMNNYNTYGASDGVLVDVGYSPTKNVWAGKVTIANFTGWVTYGNYEIVPITWVKSNSSYTVTNESIRHNYISKIQEPYYGSSGNTIGPKPDMLSSGTYYSYDGNYFYTDLQTLIRDYRANTRNNSVNKNKPYYNYYMYLSNHSRTAYSSANIDEYIRNNMGITQDAYGKKYYKNNSRLYGKGQFFYYAQEKYGVNALLSLSLSRNETANGRSNLAIVKNNGFGLDAVDSNPTQAAQWYSSFASSILGYASKYVTYGFSHPRSWKYFGSQFGDKKLGMNVKYASDPYWSEKMASNYYSFDKSKGLQDYNFYQLGVVTQSVNAMSDSSNSSRFVYKYTEAGDALIILGEKQGENVNGNTTWYKVVSDLNIDSNFNEITSGNYNWNSYVYIPAAYVLKINTGKNGYISPNDVTEYIDKNYTYDLFDTGNTLKPKVAKAKTTTAYYYDSALQTPKGQNLLQDRYVMVYAAAYNAQGNPVSYLVTSDYFHDQKEWVSANSLNFVTSEYAHVTMSTTGNYYNEVNSEPIELTTNVISGLYDNSYVPVFETKEVDGRVWFKIPVSLSNNSNVYGWVLAKTADATLTLETYTSENSIPEIQASDKVIVQGTKIDLLEDVTATDKEDEKIEVKVLNSNLDIDKVGTYQVTYQATDSKGAQVEKTITITVTENKKPVISADDKTITKGLPFDPTVGVEAYDEEDGKIKAIVLTSNVNISEIGTYQVTYQATDSYNQTVVKTINITVIANQLPTINAKDKQIYLNDDFDEYQDVEATDPEDGNITKNIKISENTVDTTKIGEYKVIYEVTDSYGDKVTKEIKVTVVEKKLTETSGNLYFDYLKEVDDKLQLRGYLTVNGMNNTLNEKITYKIIFIDEKGNTYEQKATRITDLSDIKRPISAPDNYKYTHAWFYINIDIDKLPNANYVMYAVAESDKTYSKVLVNNKLYKTEITGYKSKNKVVNIKNNYGNKTSAVTLYVRDSQPQKNVGSYYNQFDIWRTLEFVDNKLHIKGASYSYGMNLSSISKVERKIIFENKETYKTYTYTLGSITNGLYRVALPESDNLDKTRAWYDATIDVSKLEKGTYSIFITTTSNLTDISELNDNLRRSLTDKKTTINNKNYQLKLDTKNGNNIELVVS